MSRWVTGNVRNQRVMAAVSVIIPNYNHASYLKQRIDSVLQQTFDDIEVIILDDCSTDNSCEIINSYRSNTKVKRINNNDHNSNSTFCQWNKGIELSTSEIIWIAESDDFADKNFLLTLMEGISKDDKIGIAYCQSLRVNGSNEITGSWKSYTKDLDALKFEKDFSMFGYDYIRQFLIHKNTIPNASAVIFRKKYYDMVGGTETGINYCGDWMLWLKILMVSDLCFIAESLNYFRYHENSVIAKAINRSDYKKYVEENDRIMRKRFQFFLKERHPDQIRILNANYNYIIKEDTRACSKS